MNKIDISKWEQFKIGELFVLENDINGKWQVPTGCYVSKKDLNDGDTPRITVTGINNGIAGYYSSKSSNYKIFDNFISVSFLSTVFYQEKTASLDMKVHCLKLKGIELNKYIALYLVSVIRKSLENFTYADQLSSTVLPKIVISLPVTEPGKPDYKYMETYIKKLEQEQKEKISIFYSIL